MKVPTKGGMVEFSGVTLREWQKAFPHLNIPYEHSKYLEWLGRKQSKMSWSLRGAERQFRHWLTRSEGDRRRGIKHGPRFVQRGAVGQRFAGCDALPTSYQVKLAQLLQAETGRDWRECTRAAYKAIIAKPRPRFVPSDPASEDWKAPAELVNRGLAELRRMF